jgi:GNAT superfamily N-acetyltransferase
LIINTGLANKATINILPPICTGEKLLFRVFDNVAPIGYARLKKVSPRIKRVENVIDMFDPDAYSSYELKMIEISQNYRHRGVGTSLLQEVIQYCRDSNIIRLTGEIKGDSRTLRGWYSNNGFQVSNDDLIELLPLVS